jgi:hypothetical protein
MGGAAFGSKAARARRPHDHSRAPWGCGLPVFRPVSSGDRQPETRQHGHLWLVLRSLARLACCSGCASFWPHSEHHGPAAGPAVARRTFSSRRAIRLLSCCRQSGGCSRKSVCDGRWCPRECTHAGAAFLSRIPRRHESRLFGRRRFQLSGHLGIHVAHLLGPGDGASPRARKRASRLRVSGDGEPGHARSAARVWSACGPGRRLHVRANAVKPSLPRLGRAHFVSCPGRHRIEGRARSAPCLAAARASGRAEPRLGADERRGSSGSPSSLPASRPGGGTSWCLRLPARPVSSVCSTH